MSTSNAFDEDDWAFEWLLGAGMVLPSSSATLEEVAVVGSACFDCVGLAGSDWLGAWVGGAALDTAGEGEACVVGDTCSAVVVSAAVDPLGIVIAAADTAACRALGGLLISSVMSR